MLCTFATSMFSLAAFRAVQGLGAGGLFSLALAIIGDIVPPRERAKYQGYFLAVFGTASVLGPVIGGFFAGQETILGIDGWRWVFLVNVPIGIAALVVVSRTLHLRAQPPRPPHRLGRRRAALGRASCRCCSSPSRAASGAGTAGRPSTCYVIGVLGVIGFFWQEWRMKEEAILPLKLFPNRTVGVASVASVLIGIGMFGGLAALPLYLQIVKGATPDRGRPAAAADDARHHVRLDPLGPDHLPHRPLPELPDHRLGAARGRRCSSSTTSSSTPRCGRR